MPKLVGPASFTPANKSAMWYDLVVIGGGINGCGCAADAAMRGLSVLLCEQHDLASETSSKSSKLIHGGLRYLEQYQFKLVRHALKEQAVLMHLAPHLIHPLGLVLPFHIERRPSWLLRSGLFLYDHLSRSRLLPKSRALSRKNTPNYFTTLRRNIRTGFLFYDAQSHDARLTITVALQAKAHGATILTRTQFLNATPEAGHWRVALKTQDGEILHIQAKALINAAGVHVQEVAQQCQTPLDQRLSFVKGSHLLVPNFYPGKHAYLLQTSDQRIVFVMPYFGQTLIGTTDVLVSKPDVQPTITTAEIDYLKNTVHDYFRHSITSINATWSGIRVLPANEMQSPAQLSRDFSFESHLQPAPLVSVLSGKITTYRRLAEHIVNSLTPVFPNLPSSTTDALALPGGDWEKGSFQAYQNYAQTHYVWLKSNILQHYLSHYGTRTEQLLADCHHMQDLGKAFGPILHQREVDFLCETEWAKTADDILWRRTQLGLSLIATEQEALTHYMSQKELQRT